MEIEPREITIGELVEGYSDNGEDGVVGYSGQLDIRPPYQREFVYDAEQRNAVIHSVIEEYPLNVMYWAKQSDERYEVLDGQQRTISICQYVTGDFAIKDRDGNRKYFSSQPDNVQERIRRYKLTVYLCDGDHSEKLDWFKIVNIAGKRLTNQELLNAIYSGPWVSDAKPSFSRRKCRAQKISEAYVKANPIEQGLLETAIKWISDGNVDEYMARHQHDENADELWNYFSAVIEWIAATFPKKRDFMPKVDWGSLYAAHKDDDVDPDELEHEIAHLLSLKRPGREGAIQKLPGVYPYVLDGDERHLNLRSFTKGQKIAAYERQEGKCGHCGQPFEFRDMEGDHKTPWKDGGLTTDDNLQMLCRDCNRRKGAQ